MQVREGARSVPRKSVSELSDRELAEYQAVLTADVARSLREIATILNTANDILARIKIPSWLSKNKH